LSNAYREFQTAMTSGIYLVLHPRGKDADVMHAILDGFLKDHEGVREMDETTRRELKTIEFLKNKALEVEGTRISLNQSQRTATTLESNGSSHPIDAQLLLGLQQSNSRPSTALPPAHLTFLSHNMDNSLVQTGCHAYTSLPYVINVGQSPTMQRLQHDVQDEGHTDSPIGSSSPNTDEESAAQSLLDYWCNTVSGTDGLTEATSLSWGGGSNDYSGGPDPPLFGSETSLVNGFAGSDWTYWETLVKQIRAGPTP